MFPSTHQSLLIAMHQPSRRDDAWAAFDARYRDVIMGWCLRRGMQFSSAEDITQEIMLKLFARLPSYDPRKGAFRSWLKTVVHNALADSFRHQAKRLEQNAVGSSSFQQWLNNQNGEEAIAELSSAIEQCGDDAAKATFERVRSRVNEKSWQAFYQTLVENQKASDVAAVLGIQVASVYKSTYRIRKMISEEFYHGSQRHDQSESVPE